MSTEVLRLRNDEIAARAIGDEIVVLDLRTSDYLHVNSSAAPLWSRLEQGATIPELVATLTETFEIDVECAERDVRSFLATLRERNLLAPD